MTTDDETRSAEHHRFGYLCALYVAAWLYAEPEELERADREVVHVLEKSLAAGYRAYRLGIWKRGGRTRNHYLHEGGVRAGRRRSGLPSRREP
ncbi:hypothetical protein ACSNOH_01195 [Streptomyces sp. URMC 127]|uniref:hypothetical protein n=1 Tax=Streptomyces sp. URMC 127 TaxID=3423402 RepID=UPI003F1B39FA